MPGKPRLFVPGCVYHVMARGLNGMDIFVDDSDRQRFLELYRIYHQRTGVKCYAWALMSNHYHFVIRTSDIPLAKLFAPLHTRYAQYFNRKYSHRGYLFQDRFKSLATQDQLYIEGLLRYVHLNPVRAGICKDIAALDFYPWTAHASLMGNERCDFLDCQAVLERFEKKVYKARKSYREFISLGIGANIDDPLYEIFRTGTQGGNDRTDHGKWVIGDAAFVSNALARDRERRIRLARYVKEGITIESVCSKIADRFKIPFQDMQCRRSRGEIAKVRNVFVWIGHKKLEIPVNAIAAFLNVGVRVCR